MTNANVRDTVRVGEKGKTDYIVLTISQDGVARLEGVEKGTKRTANVDTLVVVKRFEQKVEAAEVTKKVSWLKRASQRLSKGKRGGKLRNA